jgi:hypothetical protein
MSNPTELVVVPDAVKAKQPKANNQGKPNKRKRKNTNKGTKKKKKQKRPFDDMLADFITALDEQESKTFALNQSVTEGSPTAQQPQAIPKLILAELVPAKGMCLCNVLVFVVVGGWWWLLCFMNLSFLCTHAVVWF